MLELRPDNSDLYLPRERLLETLPQAPGYVVHLEAPYGYGKSVLATQWADVLAADGWRIIWLSLNGRSPYPSLTRQLVLADNIPIQLVLDALWEAPTLLVLEEVTGTEDLSALLGRVGGMLLLASRQALGSPELLKLKTRGQMLHLDATSLAFTPDEARQLGPDTARLDAFWQETGGWPLPLHFSVLTGQSGVGQGLIEGVKQSLNESAWTELLLLASLPQLPSEVFNEATHQLVKSSFAQRTSGGAKLHNVLKQGILSRYQQQVKEVLLAAHERLPEHLLGHALVAAGLSEHLTTYLNSDLGYDEGAYLAEDILAWNHQAGKLGTALKEPQRYFALAWAERTVGASERAVALYLAVGREPQIDAHLRLHAYGMACYVMTQVDPARATAIFEEAMQQELAARCKREDFSVFTVNAASTYMWSGDWQTYEHYTRSALNLLPSNSNARRLAAQNLAQIAWERRGEVETFLDALLDPYEEVSSNITLNQRHMAVLYDLLGQREKALAQTEQAALNHQHFPIWSLAAQAHQAFLLADSTAFGALLREARAWQHPVVEDLILKYYLDTLIVARDLDSALQQSAEATGVMALSSRAIVLHKLGHSEEAKRLLAALPPSIFREQTIARQRARYLVYKTHETLDELISLTNPGEAVLPALIPLHELPPDRPELSLAYPVNDVLRLAWVEAIQLRDDIPALQLELLGSFEAKLLSETLDLTDRQRQILALFCLGYSRAETAEAMWPDTSVKKQRNNLNVQLNLLRKLIEPWGLSTYLFEDGLHNVQSDYADLKQALDKDDAEIVYALYRDPFAPGLDLAPVVAMRETLREDVVSCLSRAESNEPYLKRVLELEPLHEEALQALLKRLLSKGRVRDARAQYQRFERRLKEELGLTPLEATKKLLEQSYRHD